MAYKQNPARGQSDSFASFIGNGLLNKPRATKSGSGRKKEGKFITTQYTQPHQTTTQATSGSDVAHVQISSDGEDTGLRHSDGQSPSEFKTTVDKTNIKDTGKYIEPTQGTSEQTSVKRQYQDRVKEVHRKKLDKEMSKATGKDIYRVTKKKAVKQTTSMDGKPGSYTFEKYDRFGDLKKSKTKEVNKSNKDRLAKKAQKFTGSKRITRNTAQKDAKLVNERNTDGSTGVLGTGEQKIKENRRTFQQAKKEYESGEGEKTYVTNKRKRK